VRGDGDLGHAGAGLAATARFVAALGNPEIHRRLLRGMGTP